MKAKKTSFLLLLLGVVDVDHGDLQLLKPMSLCFLEGEEKGIGNLFGRKPKK